ncbi:MAG: fumarylacetoacetate hydrolase family protein [Rickettsiales bacterium]
MKLVRYTHENDVICGVVEGDMVYPLNAYFTDVPLDWIKLIHFVHRNKQNAKRSESYKGILFKTLNLELPVSPLNKIVCVGLNYKDHAIEGNQPIPEHPVFFIRYFSSFTPHGRVLSMPAVSDKYDYEAELVIVIGETLHRPSKDEAIKGIFGYSAAMDGSVRDYQKRTPQWTLGKNFDASGSIGPSIITADDLPAGAGGLKVQTRLNGELLQDGTTSDMIFSVDTLVAALAECMTLNPGDMILTGTPAGVGFARKPPLYLKKGDKVQVLIEKLDVLENTVR